jgi:hypothetical protein
VPGRVEANRCSADKFGVDMMKLQGKERQAFWDDCPVAQNIKVTLGKIHHLLELHMLGSILKEIQHVLFLAITELHIDTNAQGDTSESIYVLTMTELNPWPDLPLASSEDNPMTSPQTDNRVLVKI